MAYEEAVRGWTRAKFRVKRRNSVGVTYRSRGKDLFEGERRRRLVHWWSADGGTGRGTTATEEAKRVGQLHLHSRSERR